MSNCQHFLKIKPENFFAIGCPHFFHKNICRGTSDWDKGYRNFDFPEEMNDQIIYNINKVVPKDGILFILGDGFFGANKEKTIPEIRSRIACEKIHYLFGNHCDWLRQHAEFHHLFSSIGEYAEVLVGKQLVCMHHYPMIVWRDSHKGSWMLHSHCHATLPEDNECKRLEVSEDCQYYNQNGVLVKTDSYGVQHLKYKKTLPILPHAELLHPAFCPYSYEKIQLLVSFKENYPVDHHDSETS